MPWLQSPISVLLSSILFPPLGLVLLWMRKSGVLFKLAGSVLILGIGIVELFRVYGLRMEMRGSGGSPMFTFRSKEKLYSELEKSRASQAPPPATTKPEEPSPVVAAKVEPKTEEAKVPVVEATSYWIDFRGPLRDGIYTQKPLLETWPAEGLKPLYKQPIGMGYASFVVGAGRAFTIEQRRDKEAVTAYDLKTGRELWAHSYPAQFQESLGGEGPRATPTYHGGLVYSLGATGELRVLDAKTGTLKWSKQILTDNNAGNLQWGASSSPLIVDDKVVVQPGGTNGTSIVAYEKNTGRKIWASQNDQAAYTSPMLVNLAGVRQILAVTSKRVVGLDPESGKLLWDYPWVTQYNVNSAQPLLVDSTHFILSAGYGHGTALVELTSGNAKTVWENNRMKNRFNTSVLHKGYMYGIDEGIFVCMRISDGQQMWKAGRYGYGQLLLAGDRIILVSEQGELVLIEPSPDKLNELAKFQAIEGKTWNNLAIEDGILLVRNGAEMAAFNLSK